MCLVCAIVCVGARVTGRRHTRQDADIHEDAALVVNNCAAFCEDVCLHIAQCPGMLDALKHLILHGCDAAKR